MLKQETIDQIAGTLGLDAEEFAQGITSESEVEFKIPTGAFFTDEQKETLLDNHGKTRYDAGVTAAREMQLKEMSELAGFESSIKDKQKFIEHLKSQVLEQAKIEPNKKVKELQDSLTTLQGQLQQKDSEYSALEGKWNNYKERTSLLGKIPALKEGLGLSNDDVLDIFQKSHEIKEGVVYKDGNPLKDDLQNPLSIDSVLSSFVTDKGWNPTKTPKGRGKKGIGDGGSGDYSYEAYLEDLKSKGLHEGSMEAQSLLKQYSEKNPDIFN